jgi:hypothetical protein
MIAADHLEARGAQALPVLGVPLEISIMIGVLLWFCIDFF